MIRVLVADDQALVRGGVRMILDAQPDIEVVAEAADGVQAVAAARGVRPDVALVDIRMPRLDGLETTRRIVGDGRHPTRVVILTTFDLDEYLYEAIRAGATGFLLKSAPPDQLVAGVRAAVLGDALLAPEITRRLLDRFAERPLRQAGVPEELAELSPRERDVLRLMAEGRSNAEIAAALTLGESTIKTHVNHILGKLRLRDRVQAVALAYRSGFMDASGS